MSKKKILFYLGFTVCLFLGWFFSPSNQENSDVSERTKVALRSVGNELLLINKDTTSLVLPIKEIGNFKYRVSFQNRLFFEPSQLVDLIKKSFDKTSLPKKYRVEVIQCSDNEVAYSYEINNETEKNIIPCKGRELPNNCYLIELKFINVNTSFFNQQFFLFSILLLLIFFGIDYVFSRPKGIENSNQNTDVPTIGSYQFFPTQNKLVKQAVEISLSKKECELLVIFNENQNQIVTREELTKKVWEDNGVFVGRSLDTYISKLRKKLSDDTTIKIVNVHGVGYKLEVND